MPHKPVTAGSLHTNLPTAPLTDEQFAPLVTAPGVRIERIVSTGQATPDGEWYDQEMDEWVLLTAGAARLRIDGESSHRNLTPGDWLHLPAHCRHRVTWTQAEPPTVWVAVHFGGWGTACRAN